jgi:uncharacterized membrane protein YagU involved in acid resistance
MMLTDKSRALRAILLGGLIAGTLDISYACIFSYIRRGTSPVRILQSVASGALGRSAFDGGAKTAALGLVFHFMIATIAAAVYYLASRPLRFLVSQALICGPLYGVCIYLVMNFVVLPLSAIGSRPALPLPVLIGGLLIHMLGIGLPIALMVRRYSR